MLYCKSDDTVQLVDSRMVFTLSRAPIKKAICVRTRNVKKIVFLVFVLVLLSTATGVVFIKPVVAGATIYINPDGSVTGTDKIQQDGNVYTFTDDISDSIVVLIDDIVVDGAGYTLQGTPTVTGIDLTGRSNVTIKNMQISSFLYGIRLEYSSNTTISGNKITGSLHGGILLADSNYNSLSGNSIVASGGAGIVIDSSSNYNSISGNNVTNTDYGLRLYYSSSNTLSGNKITTNNYGITLSYSSSNTLSGNKISSYRFAGIWFEDSNYNSISENNVSSNGWGIWFGYSSYNSLSGNKISSGLDAGIRLGYSNYNSISGNKITNSKYGFSLEYSSNNTISGNNVTENNDHGIWMQFSSNNTLRNNDASNNKYNLGIYSSSLSHCIQDIDDSNTVNGKPVYYWVNKQDMTVPLDAGYVALVNCTNITVQNLKLDNNWQGALLAYTTNSTITKNDVTNNAWGIELDYSSNNNTVSENNITNNDYGIWLYESSNNNTISGNKVINNDYGIKLDYSSSNTISGNSITENNNHGVWFKYSSSNSIYENNITNNVQEGIWFEWSCNYNNISGNKITNNYDGIWLYESSNNNTISGNNIMNNDYGLWLDESSNNTISENNVKYNDYGIGLNYSSSNVIYHNNFVTNTYNVYIETSGYANFWDNGYPAGGNFWSDYEDRYPYAEEIDGSGIWDTPYVIDENNQDNYPMTVPIGEVGAVRIVFEEAHLPLFTIGGNPAYGTAGGYSEFANYLIANGYAVSTIDPGTTIDAGVLAPADVLVIAAPDNSYSTSEIDAIEAWVNGGGRLLLISEWGNEGAEESAIAARFGITLPLDMLHDTDEYVTNDWWPYYDGANLLSHPITAGVARIEIYASDGITSAPADEIPLIVTDSDGTGTWHDGSPALGVSVMSALNGGTAGSGRLIVITDSNIWDSVYDSDGDGALDFYDSDNEVLALNAIDWLAAEFTDSPIASFTHSPESPVYTGEVITFNASSSYDPDGSIVSYDWDFGEPSATGSGEIVSYSYADDGVYTVTLTVTDDDFETAVTSIDIIVLNRLPEAFFTENATTVDTGEAIFFDASGSYDLDGSIVSYSWDFGDESTGSGVTVTHVYVDDGTYIVTLTVTDDDGAADTATATKTIMNRPPVAIFFESTETAYVGETITFNASDSYDPDGSIVTYFWDFGDGTNTNGVVVEHAYSTSGTYIVTLTVIDDDSASDSSSSTKTILQNEPPVATFTESADTVYTSEIIYFNASDSYDLDGYIVSYFWDFGDGTTTTGVTANHAYADDGIYTVTLTVTDDRGATSSTSATKTVLNRAPIASFTESAETVHIGESITFNATESYDPDGTLVEYFWDFGDGTTTTGAVVNHAYTDNGTYTVTLTVTDDDGETDSTTSIKYVVNNPPYQPQLSITPNLTVEDNDDLIVTVTGPTPADPDGDTVTYTYRWLVDVGTGQFVDDEVAGRGDHTGNMVPAADTAVGDVWRVEVAPQDEHGAAGPNAIATWQMVVVDATKPVAHAGPDQTVNEDTRVNFDGSGSTDNVGIVNYVWAFTDVTPQTLTGKNPNHIFATPGTYTVTLNVTDAAGNWATDTVVITVLPVTPSDGTGQDSTVQDGAQPTPKPDVTKPVANAGPDKLVVENKVASFDAGGSSDNVGIVSCEWDFGDGTTGTGITVTHTYTELGNYTVTLTVKDAVGNSHTDSISVTVQKDTDGDGDPDVTDTDDDNDDMPDTWETDNGLDPLDAQDASLDPDNDGLTNLQEYTQSKDPNAYDAEAIYLRPLYVVAAAVGAFTVATAAILANLTGLGASFDSAISKLPIPDELKEFLQLYGEKLFETVDKAKLEALEKAPFITRGEVVALGVSALIATIVFGVEEAKGLQNFLTYAGLANFILPALVSVCVVIIFAELFETCCARICRVRKQFKLWMYGVIMFLVSGLVFQFPLGSPGITKYRSGEISKKAKGLFVLSKMLLLLSLTIPFAGLLMLGFNTVGEIGLSVGEIGLWLTLITIFSSLIPLRPLVGKALFDYRKEVSLTALAVSGILLFSFIYSRLTHVTFLPHVIYLAVGAVSAFLAAITLSQLRKAHPTGKKP